MGGQAGKSLIKAMVLAPGRVFIIHFLVLCVKSSLQLLQRQCGHCLPTDSLSTLPIVRCVLAFSA